LKEPGRAEPHAEREGKINGGAQLQVIPSRRRERNPALTTFVTLTVKMRTCYAPPC